MAGGWTADGAVGDQIEDSVADEVARARALLAAGRGAGDDPFCVECGEEIPPARRAALPDVRFCVDCQEQRDRNAVRAGINRRGSKDSQLK